MILLNDVNKTYFTKNQAVEALKKVNLNISKGEIFGVIGYSGAGKSTLIRCINLLERPTSGKVIVDGKELTSFSPKQLRQSRKKIGMIFQHFNLMKARSVFQNIAYPLKGSGLNSNQIQNKVYELLELVGLNDKAHAYPSQLSGGQKQRVAIARALANDPKVLLCDEATSALDPQTTKSILKLLKEINEKLGLTIVIITHEMQVIKEICNRVAVMENGEIVENGDVLQVFSKPKESITKSFVSNIFHYNNIQSFYEDEHFVNEIAESQMLAKISFMGQKTGQPFISRISRVYKIDASILFGNIENIQNVPIGSLIVRLSGNKVNILEAIKYLEDHNIYVEVIKDVNVDKDISTESNRVIS
ncbi:methionine ABC transporter ATP-binding protein [Brassicibacter mesophilus]|uniref:methionine ABC transporter ATP-binding protein n=1 Tax=Brassicibacter mesophilus TaxID=745119 RepID=UPI003D2342C9